MLILLCPSILTIFIPLRKPVLHFTVRWGKWSKEVVRYQMDHYCADGLQPWSSEKLPYSSGMRAQHCYFLSMILEMLPI